MTEQAIVKTDAPVATLPEAVEQALVNGNLAQLSSEQRVVLYKQVCDSQGLNPLTTPFQYITLNGKLVLYCTRNCTDQLRKIHNVDVAITGRERTDDIYVVTARAKLPNGRADEEIGAVAVAGLKGEALANAMMKAGTKAKRRVTLSIVGLSLLDETEVETIPGAKIFIESESESSPAGDRATPALVDGSSLGESASRAADSAPAGGDAFYGAKQVEAAARETPTKSNSGAMPSPEHAPASEPALITAFFERARGEWQTTRAQTRLLLDPNGLDDDLNDEAAVRAALVRFGQTATDKGLDRLFTLCSPAREAVTA